MLALYASSRPYSVLSMLRTGYRLCSILSILYAPSCLSSIIRPVYILCSVLPFLYILSRLFGLLHLSSLLRLISVLRSILSIKYVLRCFSSPIFNAPSLLSSLPSSSYSVWSVHLSSMLRRVYTLGYIDCKGKGPR